MIDKTEQSHRLAEREVKKGTRFEYAYRAPQSLGRWAILGSIVRAVGKNWQVSVISDSQRDHQLVHALQELLQDPTQIQLSSGQHYSELDFSNTHIVSLLGLDPTIITKIRNHPQVLGSAHVMTVENSPSDQFDLISNFSREQLNQHGVTAITGTGKGKTTSALGIAAEVLSQGEKVAVVQWFKERKIKGDLTWAINEHRFPDKLQTSAVIEFHPTGLGFYGSPNMDRLTGEQAYQQHRQKAYQGLTLAREKIASGKYGLVILDELIDTVKEIAQNIDYPLVDLPDLQAFLTFATRQSHTPIVVTGRRVTDDWADFIKDSVTISEVKHPWSSRGKGAVSGLDY